MIFSLQTIKKKWFKTAAQISEDKNLLNQLSQEEAPLVGYTAASEKNQEDWIAQQAIHDEKIPKHKVVAQEYVEPYDTKVYTLEEKSTQNKKQKTAAEISKDKKLVKGLKAEDAHAVGFASATEQKWFL